MKNPFEELLNNLKENNLHIWDAEERMADMEDFIFDFIKTYYLPHHKPCDIGAEEMQRAEFYLNLADFTDETGEV